MGGRVSRFVLAALMGGLVVLWLGAPARAQTCYTLQAELEHLESQGTSGLGSRERYDRAWRVQGEVLARTEARARDANCFGGGGFLFFRDDPEPICDILIPKLRKMQDNMAKLDRLRLLGGRDNSDRMRQLRRMIARRRCGQGDSDMEAENPAPSRDRVYADAGEPSNGDAYRTMCVRTCDGYYFPISFSTTRENFDADAQSCSAMCPGAESSLFYYRNPGGTPQEMVSLQGDAYASLSTAFQYRKRIDSACTCRSAGNMSAIPADPPGGPDLDRGAALPRPELATTPKPRPQPGEDPETLADRDGGFTPRTVDAKAAVAAARPPSSGKPVRVVGPAYWGAPAQAGAVLTPVPN